MNDKHKKINTFKLIVTACLFLVLSACSNDDNTVTTSETITELPQFIQNIAESHTGSGVLGAEISFNGSDGTFEKMDIDTVNHKSIIKKVLSKKEYIVTIRFMYTIGTRTMLLCKSDEVKIDLSKGDENITLGESNYTCDDEPRTGGQGGDLPKQYDDDNDGVSNRQEILNGTNPFLDERKPPGDKKITSLTITPSNEEVTVGQTLILTATIIYDDRSILKIRSSQTGIRLDWSSTNPSIARVNNDGVVTGVAALGTTTSISVTLRNEEGTLLFQPSPLAVITTVAAASEVCKLDGTSTLNNCKLQ